ncbi:MAG: hypothetical protein AAGC85_08455, partial [Bacteroidota bacterium]
DFDELVLKELKPRIKKRLSAIVTAAMSEKTIKAEDHPYKDNIYPQDRWTKFTSRIRKSVLYGSFARSKYRKFIVNFTLPLILDKIAFELHKHDLIKDNPKPPDTRINKKEDR